MEIEAKDLYMVGPESNWRRIGNYVEDMFKVIKDTDSENWAYFGEEEKKTFSLNFLKYGNLSRLIYYKNEPIGYVDMYLLKPIASALLNEDYYHKIGLEISDLRVPYRGLGNDFSYESNELYINVLAVKEAYQGNVLVINKIINSIFDILDYNLIFEMKRNYPRRVYAVAITRNGERMCHYLNFNKVSISERQYGESINKRVLYTMNTNELFKKLKKIIEK